MNTTTTTTSAGHNGLQVGDYITLSLPDTRWWRRAIYWLLRRGEPKLHSRSRVTIVSQTTLTIDPYQE